MTSKRTIPPTVNQSIVSTKSPQARSAVSSTHESTSGKTTRENIVEFKATKHIFFSFEKKNLPNCNR